MPVSLFPTVPQALLQLRQAEAKIVGRFRFIRKHARHGIRLCNGTESVVLYTHSPVNDDEPIILLVLVAGWYYEKTRP
jgi:hypothetical protein